MIYIAIGKCENNIESQHKAGRFLLSSILNSLGYDNAEIKKAETGRPYVDIIDTDISISHSGAVAIAAVISPLEIETNEIIALPYNGKHIGIDIEEIKPGSIEKKQRIAERFLKSTITTEREFYRLWTQNEAYGKMTGEGVLCKKDDSFLLITFTVELCEKEYSLSISIK